MSTTTSTNATKTKRTPKKTLTIGQKNQKKTPVKVSNAVLPELREKVPTEIYPKAVQLTSDEQGKSFFWEEYSQRTAAITANDFETVYYFAFPTEQAAKDFVNAILGNFCKECSFRSSKRFNPDEFPFEVKVWGMSEATFFHLVKRDLERK